MLKLKPFKGSTVYMSRNLVPPEVFDKLHGALKDNGADVFLCCDPSRNGTDDFHVISSVDHEKFEDLRAKGCNLIGPQCVLSCSKENKALPKQGFTCCLAMDGLKVLASGFEMEEKNKIEKLVLAMGGTLVTKASLDVSFVIVKNVLAAKYKWASNTLKKPIVTIQWLYQCWNEHRVVPQESYRVLPFLGLTICVTRIPAEERKEVEKHIIQNGGKYSPELTKKCTHLICDISYIPEGDKYKVARRWGHINIVTRKWFDQSIIKRACLIEESFPVQYGPASKSVKGSLVEQHSRDLSAENLHSVRSSTPAEISSRVVPSRFEDPDLEATLSQNLSPKFSDVLPINEGGNGGEPNLECSSQLKLDGFVANDSQSEDNDLYLSDCRVFLIGFEASEMRKLVRIVRQGGASRYMSFNEKLTHIVVGTPSELEKKQVRSLAASGVIQVVRAIWLEDCHCAKKEVPVQPKHVYDLSSKDSIHFPKGLISNFGGSSKNKCPTLNPEIDASSLFGKSQDEKKEINICKRNLLNVPVGLSEQTLPTKKDDRLEMHHDPVLQANRNMTSTNVFEGKIFCFSNSFPEDRRGEIVQWVDQGGGEIVDGQVKQNVDFIVECHGVITKFAVDAHINHVSTHWVRSCLEDGSLLDVRSHILYSPLPCQVPFPGFENFRFCVSQYEEKERLLLRNLCFVLGAKFVEKLTKRVTHLLCKFTTGPKYEAACKWGIHLVTSEWIYECVSQNRLVPMEPFFPREATTEDQEAGLCTVSQFPTQAVRRKCGDNKCERQSQGLRPTQGQGSDCKTLSNSSGIISCSWEEEKQANSFSKKPKLIQDHQNGRPSSGVCSGDAVRKEHLIEDKRSKDTGGAAQVVPDVATAIEDLLEQTSKIHDQKCSDIGGCHKSIFSSECTTALSQDHSDPHSITGLSKQRLNSTPRKDAASSRSGGIYDGFSETQTESQVVGYEEDLSGRQMLIDRVRTRSSMA